MAQKINKVYDDAVASGLLPGVSLFAGDKDGNVIYTHSTGLSSLNPSHPTPFTPSTICTIASMTKLMTSVSILQLVEDGLLNLDADIRPLLPSLGQHGIITSFDDATNTATLTPIPEAKAPVTTRMLLSHTSGHEYDWFNPLLAKWRASRGEAPWTGPTVEDKSALPLVFPPGKGFAYGAGHDWAGKIVEIVSGKSLDEFMRERIWGPLGIKEDEAGFYPDKNEGMKAKMAGMSSLNEKGEGPAFDLPGFDMLFGGKECLGGAGVYCSAEVYYKFLSAVLRRDGRLFKKGESFEDLLRPQLEGEVERAFNEYLAVDQAHIDTLACRIPGGIRKNFSFAGLVTGAGQEGRFGKGTIFWGGVPCCQWFIDRESGVCGVAVCQVLPPMCPSIVALHEEFQRGVMEIVKGRDA